MSTITTQDGLIGKRIKYSIQSLQYEEGLVLDKIEMLNTNSKKGEQQLPTVVTGYLVETEDGELKSIQYWRVFRVIKSSAPKVVPLHSEITSQQASGQ